MRTILTLTEFCDARVGGSRGVLGLKPAAWLRNKNVLLAGIPAYMWDEVRFSTTIASIAILIGRLKREEIDPRNRLITGAIRALYVSLEECHSKYSAKPMRICCR